MDLSKFKYTGTIKKTNIDIYVFVICSNLKNNIEYISKVLDIKNIPKKLFDDCNLKSNFEKKMYTDNYEIIFLGVAEEYKCGNKNLYETFGKIAKNLHANNKKVLVHLVGDDQNNIKNQVCSYILGSYHFTKFKTGIKENN